MVDGNLKRGKRQIMLTRSWRRILSALGLACLARLKSDFGGCNGLWVEWNGLAHGCAKQQLTLPRYESFAESAKLRGHISDAGQDVRTSSVTSVGGGAEPMSAEKSKAGWR